MKSEGVRSLLCNSAKEQKVLMNDERFLTINEKVSHSVSKIMNWILIALLFITAVLMKSYIGWAIISGIIVTKFVLTLIYVYYYNRKI